MRHVRGVSTQEEREREREKTDREEPLRFPRHENEPLTNLSSHLVKGKRTGREGEGRGTEITAALLLSPITAAKRGRARARVCLQAFEPLPGTREEEGEEERKKGGGG